MRHFSRIFSVTPDVEHFLLLQETALEMSMQASTNDFYILDGSPKGKAWLPVNVDWLIVPGEKGLTTPDIAGWGATALAISANKSDALKSALADNCELLPLTLNNEAWFALNVTAKYDAINAELTEHRFRRDGRPDRIRPFKRFVLNADAIATNGLFRVEGAGLTIFCTDQENGFYDVVKKQKMTGIKFTEKEVI